jgi:hypothetical protein
MNLRYLLDEHAPHALQKYVSGADPVLDVWKLGDASAPPLGTLDPQILIWREANDFVLVTNNRKSMPLHLADHLHAGNHVPGIFVLDTRLTLQQMGEDLILIALRSFDDEHRDLITFLPLSI